jgi:hypothetical protein
MWSPRCVCESRSTNFWMPEPVVRETWYVYHATWAHLNGVLHESLWSVCVSVCVAILLVLGKGCEKCIPISLPGYGSTNTFSRQRIHSIIEELLDACVCVSVCVSFYRWKVTTR